ncbi:MAG: tetratricopeptide repeat protein [Anaeromyxobacter sp.]
MNPEGRSPGADALERGLAAFVARSLDEAHAAFERAHRADPREPRAMSWYGVTLVLVERNSNLGVLLCDQALRTSGPSPELLLNAARVHLALNQRERAVRHVKRGLELWPEDGALTAARLALGRRSSPVLPFLPRGNPVNVWLGKLRHRWRQRRAPVLELSPLSLGLPEPRPAPPAPPAGEEA